MATETSGCGYIDGNAGTTANGYTYLDRSYGATEDFLCDQIDINVIYYNASGFSIGWGFVTKETWPYEFTVEHSITVDVGSTGQVTLNAPTDFTAFTVEKGGLLCIYSSNDTAKIDRTTSGSGVGGGFAAGDQVTPGTFEYGNATGEWLEIQLSGETYFSIAADTGTLTLSGAVDFSETFVAATGSLTLSGAAELVTEGENIAADTGSLTLSGAAAFDETFAAATGSLTLSGAAAFDETFSAATATLSLSGAALFDETLICSLGSLTLSGAAAFDETFIAAVATLSLSGAAAFDETFIAATATLTLSGAAELVDTETIEADTGTLTLSGAAAFDETFIAATGSLTLSSDADLAVSVLIAADTGTLTLSGAALFDETFALDTAALTLSGAALFDETFAAGIASLTLSGAADILAGRVIEAATGSLTLSGAAELIRALLIAADTGSLTLSSDADLIVSSVDNDIAADTGVLTLSGDAELSEAAILSPFVDRKDFYAMRQIPYNNASVPLSFSFPLEWDPTLVTEITLTIKDRTGTDIRSPEAITLYTATTLAADAARFANTITLAVGSDSPVDGDTLLIAGSAGSERVIVEGYDSTTRIVTIEGTLDRDHDSGDAVYGCQGSITIDTTTITTFPAGLVMTLLWIPTGTGNDTTETAKIALSQLDVEGLDKRFSRLYTRAHEALTKPVNRLPDMLDEAERQLRLDMRARNLEYDRIIDQDIIAPALMAKMAFLWALNGDVAREDERKSYAAEYSAQFSNIMNMPLWQDHDQDLAQDSDTDEETTTHEHVFDGGW